MLTGRLRREPRQAPPPMPMPRTPEELQALFESLVAAGKIPQEVLDRMAKGERFVLKVTPQGLVLAPAAADGAPPPADGAAAAAPPAAAPGPAGAPPAAAAPPPPASRLAPVGPRSAAPRPAPASARPTNAPKPGRNDVCPCGSGIKYKKCCAPAFD
jgi:hypothetical protein